MVSNDSKAMSKAAVQKTLGDRIRGIADQLKQETDLQIKATSRILGAAAQISQNHDRLIDEVVEIVEEDLEQQTQMQAVELITVEQLKRQFKTLSKAKAHFGVKANSWAALAEKLNEQTIVSRLNSNGTSASQRLETIEGELRALRNDLGQVLTMLEMILKRVS